MEQLPRYRNDTPQKLSNPNEEALQNMKPRGPPPSNNWHIPSIGGGTWKVNSAYDMFGSSDKLGNADAPLLDDNNPDLNIKVKTQLRDVKSGHPTAGDSSTTTANMVIVFTALLAGAVVAYFTYKS